MEVYFIRHGQTKFNKEHRHQSGDSPLNDLGRQQAEALKKLISKFNPTHVISSPYFRAKETAEIATADTNLQIEFNELFIELVRPKSILGRTHGSLLSIKYLLKWFYHKNKSFGKNAGESRLLFLNRIHEAKEFLETFPKDSRIVVFSHSVYINFFVEHICNEKPVSTLNAILLLLKIKALNNSSLTHLTYSPELAEGICKWNLVKFDDDSHVVT